jgi:Tc toxin complex TcA C-terminal TcB-binding domain
VARRSCGGPQRFGRVNATLEIAKDVSLAGHDPAALLALRQSGSCEISLSEALFDLDHPGHYLRRIKTVEVSVVSVVGPYSGDVVLMLLASSVRHSDELLGGTRYAREQDDPRFTDIAGVREFEGAGAVSEWRIELPPASGGFGHETIEDVVLQLVYTARDGGERLARRSAEEARSAG